MNKDVSVLVAHSYLTLCDPVDYSLPGSSVREILLQGIIAIQGLNPGLLHYRWILYHLRHQGSPKCINTTINMALYLENTWRMLVEDPLEEGLATHSSILAGKIPWTEEPSGLQSMGPQRVDMTDSEQPVLVKVDTGRDCSFWGMCKVVKEQLLRWMESLNTRCGWVWL